MLVHHCEGKNHSENFRGENIIVILLEHEKACLR